MSFQLPPHLRTQYIERRRQDLETLRSSLASQDFTTFARMGHQLKGNAASYGFPELEAIAIAMEIAGVNQAQDAAQACVKEFERWLGSKSLAQPQ